MGSSSNSSYGDIYGLPGTFAPVASYELLRPAWTPPEARRAPAAWARSTRPDQFYYPKGKRGSPQRLTDTGMLAEWRWSPQTLLDGRGCRKKSLAIFTVSDSLLTA